MLASCLCEFFDRVMVGCGSLFLGEIVVAFAIFRRSEFLLVPWRLQLLVRISQLRALLRRITYLLTVSDAVLLSCGCACLTKLQGRVAVLGFHFFIQLLL